MVGSIYRDRFILGAGTDSADGLGGFDTVRYDRFDVSQGVTVNLQDQQATGVWDGKPFTHTLVNIEEVRGSRFDDQLVAANSGSNLLGREGDDVLQGGPGDDFLDGGSGRDTVLQPTSGSFDFTGVDIQADYQRIEVLSMEDGSVSDTLTLSINDIFDFVASADALLQAEFGPTPVSFLSVNGDVGDTLFLDDPGSADQGSQITDGDGRTLDVYQFSDGGGMLAIVAVDQGVSVQGIA